MINVIGQSYIGLPTALVFVNSGYEIVGIYYNEELINKLKDGTLTFEEKSMDNLFIEGMIKK